MQQIYTHTHTVEKLNPPATMNTKAQIITYCNVSDDKNETAETEVLKSNMSQSTSLETFLL